MTLFVHLIRIYLWGAIYRLPDSGVDNFTTALDKLIATLTFARNENIFLAGDFNINLFNTDNHQPTKHFLEMMLSNHLLSLICHQTRVTSASATLIDNIFTNVTAKLKR